MRKNEMKNGNLYFDGLFQDGDEALVILDLASRYDRTGIIAFRRAEFDKIHEPDDPETESKKGTRHPSTRAERRKKTAHAKARKANTVRTREMRKIPYSQMLGKGKKHDHVWIYEDSIPETRSKAKWRSEVRDLWRWVRNELEEKEEAERHYWDYDEDYYYNKLQEAREEISDKADYIRFLESRIRDLEREIGF